MPAIYTTLLLFGAQLAKLLMFLCAYTISTVIVRFVDVSLKTAFVSLLSLESVMKWKAYSKKRYDIILIYALITTY